MKAKANRGGAAGAIARFNYACLLHLYEENQYQVLLERWQSGGGKGNQPQLSHAGSISVLKQASSSLSNASKGKGPKNAAPLYYYGYTLALLGDVSAVNRLDEVMTRYKTTRYASQASLVLGEFYFDNKDPQKAFREYSSTAKSKDQLVQLYTRYKQAWINYALGVDGKDQNKKKKAIMQLVSVSKLAEKKKKGKLYKKMIEIVKNDLMALLIDFGNLDEARRILLSVGAKDVSANLVEQMAYTKLNAGDVKGSYNLFQMAVKEDPMRSEAPVLTTNMVRLAGQMNNVKLVAANLNLLVKNYVKDKKWRGAQKEPLLKKTDADVEAVLYEFATIIDRQGRETANAQYLTVAQQLYALFLKTFPKSNKGLELRYNIAQIQLQMKQYAKAAKMLYTLIKKNPKFPQKKEASELMVTAAQFVVDNDKTAYKVPDPGTPLSPQKIPPNRQLYAECLELFLQLQPKNPLAPTMDYTVASIYYDYGHFDKAIKSYYSYIKRYPTGEFAKQAAARVLIYHQKQFDDKGLAKAKAFFLQIPAFKSDPQLVAMINATTSVANKSKQEQADLAAKKGKKNGKNKAGEADDADGQSDVKNSSDDTETTEEASEEESEEAIEASTPKDDDDTE